MSVFVFALSSFLIWDAHIGWPGSSGDSTVFKTTALASHLDGRADSIFLPTDYGIGDQGYALEAQVLTPYGNPVTPAQHYFNYKHSAARRCVEQVCWAVPCCVSAAPRPGQRCVLCWCCQTFGILKRMWRLLDMKTEEHKENKVRSTWCALLLHNMILRYRMQLAETPDLDPASLHELRGGQEELEGDLAHVDMELGVALGSYVKGLTQREVEEIEGVDSGEDDVPAGGAGRGGVKRRRSRDPKSAASKKIVACARRTEVAADVYFARYGRSERVCATV